MCVFFSPNFSLFFLSFFLRYGIWNHLLFPEFGKDKKLTQKDFLPDFYMRRKPFDEFTPFADDAEKELEMFKETQKDSNFFFFFFELKFVIFPQEIFITVELLH